MESIEIKKELKLTYDELVEYLLNKYGSSKYDYFCNESCKSKNPKVSRTKEGLYCHHIDEDKALQLSQEKFAKLNPWEYQKAERLVYCNVLEHLILHIKIVEEQTNEDSIQGLGGVLTICPEINDYYNGYIFQKEYLNTTYSIVENNFKDYIEILKYFLNIIDKRVYLKKYITREYISKGYEGQIIEKVYNEIKINNKPTNKQNNNSAKQTKNASRLINRLLNSLFRNFK